MYQYCLFSGVDKALFQKKISAALKRCQGDIHEVRILVNSFSLMSCVSIWSEMIVGQKLYSLSVGMKIDNYILFTHSNL